jgi:hypothetical protein
VQCPRVREGTSTTERGGVDNHNDDDARMMERTGSGGDYATGRWCGECSLWPG